jgi:hypothetical protein
MQTPSEQLREIKAKIEKALVDKGFQLETFTIEVEEDDNHTAHLRLRLLPEALKGEQDIQIDKAFTDIIKGMGL